MARYADDDVRTPAMPSGHTEFEAPTCSDLMPSSSDAMASKRGFPSGGFASGGQTCRLKVVCHVGGVFWPHRQRADDPAYGYCRRSSVIFCLASFNRPQCTCATAAMRQAQASLGRSRRPWTAHSAACL